MFDIYDFVIHIYELLIMSKKFRTPYQSKMALEIKLIYQKEFHSKKTKKF